MSGDPLAQFRNTGQNQNSNQSHGDPLARFRPAETPAQKKIVPLQMQGPPISAMKKPNIIDLANNSSNGLTLDTLFNSKLPTWQKVIASPLGAIGTGLKEVVESPLGSRFLGASGGITMDKGTPVQPVGDAGFVPNHLAELGGNLAGFALQGHGVPGGLGFGSSEKVINNVLLQNTGKGIEGLSKLAQYGIKAGTNAGELGAFSGLDTGLKGGSNKDILNSALQGGLQGAVFGAGMKGLGDIGKSAFPGWKTTKFETMKEAPLNDLGTNNNVILAGGSKEIYSNPKINNPNGVLKPSITNLNTDTLPLESRDFKNVGDKSVNAYQFDHPELKPYIQQEANILQGELQRTIPATRGNNTINGPIGEDNINTSSPRITSDSIAQIKDITGASYDKIGTALDNIKKDSGAENNALSKRIELVINDRLSNGYHDDQLGQPIPAHQGYLEDKNFIQSMPDNINNSKVSKSALNILQSKVQPVLTGSEKITLDPNTPNWAGKPTTVTNTPIGVNKPLESPLKAQNMASSIKEPSPDVLTGELGQSKFIENSIQNSEIAPQVMKDTVGSQPYIKITNQETWNNALKNVEENHQSSLNEFFNSKDLKSADDTALGQALIVKAIKENRIGDANELSVNLAEKLSRAGQTVQAASIFKRLSPEGMLQYANNVVGRINKVIEKETGTKDITKNVKLTTEEANKILQGMKEYQGMAEGDAKNIKIAQIMQIINDKQPSTLVDKIRALRNISLLGNAKTQVRNVVGNTIMGVADNGANTIGTPLDKLISLKTKQRAVGLPSLGIQAKGFINGAKNAIQDSFGGITLKSLEGKTFKEKVKILSDGFANPINREINGNSKFETGNRLAFNNKPMRMLENTVGTGLKIGDNSFKQAYTDDILHQLMKTNKVTIATDEMKAIAGKIADERTYQDNNGLTKLATGVKNLPQKLENGKLKDATQIFVDSQLPYVRTPANILKRAIEYTPAGIIDGGLKINKLLKNGAKSGNYDMSLQRAGVDRISRGLVGTGIMGLGALGASKGILTGSASKDKDMAALDAQTGKQPYAVKLPNGQYYNYNWAQPISMPLSGGVQMVQGKKGQPVSNGLDAISNALNFYTDQPMLQSIQKLVGSQYDNKGVGQRITDAALTIPNQFVPTALKQATQMIDPNVRSSYSPDALQKTSLNPMQAKIPGLSSQMPSKYGTLGREVKQFQGNNNLFNVALNPGNLTTDKTTPVEKMITDTYKATGDSTIFPRVVPQSITYKLNPGDKKSTKYDFTSTEYAQFQKTVGTETNIALNNSIDTLNNLDNESRAKVLNTIINKVYDRSKKEFILNKQSK